MAANKCIRLEIPWIDFDSKLALKLDKYGLDVLLCPVSMCECKLNYILSTYESQLDA